MKIEKERKEFIRAKRITAVLPAEGEVKAIAAGTSIRRKLGWAPWVTIPAIMVAWALLAWKANVDPQIAYLPSYGSVPWIVYPSPGQTRAHPATELSALFRRRFMLESPPRSAILVLRAFNQFEVRINGESAAILPEKASWKVERRADVGPQLRAGENLIEVRVSNGQGPPALWLALDLPGRTLGSDTEWEASWAGSAWRRADLATQPKRGQPFDPAGRMMKPAEGLIARWTTILLFAVISGIAVAVCFWLVPRRKVLAGQVTSSPWPLRAAMATSALLWTALFLNNSPLLHLTSGFDAWAHLDYVHYILEKHSIPLADQGLEMYQPPLYYVAAAAVLRAANLSLADPGAALAFRFLGLVLGLINLVLVGAFLRLVFPGDPRRQVIGLVMTAFLPAHLYLYQFPTNEVLVITLSSAVLFMTLRDLRDEEPSLRGQVLLGALLGLALLTKVTALLLVPVILGVLALRVTRLPRGHHLRGLVGIGMFVLTALLVCGWHYVRLWLRFGSPFIGGWDARTGFLWWQDPGYHTLPDYLRFGRVLISPIFAGFHSIWDGLYSTLWGDGLVSGAPALTLAPPWSYDLMSPGYLLALIPAAATALGAFATFIGWVRRPNSVDTLLLGLASLVWVSILYMTLLAPYYAHNKAFHGLAAGLLPLSVFAARGLDLVIGRRRWLAGILLMALGTWALTAYATFWVDGGSAQARAALGIASLANGEAQHGEALLRDALTRDPEEWDARVALARHLLSRRGPRAEVERVLEAEKSQPNIAARHHAIGVMAALDGEFDRALEEAKLAVRLDPDAPEGHALVAALLESRSDLEGAVASWREVLRIDPYFRKAHEALARLYTRLGSADSAAMHQEYATRLGH